MSDFTSKLFVGCLVTAEMKYAFGKNARWKEQCIAWQSDPLGMREIRFEEQDYFGKYVENKAVFISKIKEIENEISLIIEDFFPTFLNKNKIVVFPQFLVG